MSIPEEVRRRERAFMWATLVIWLMLTVPIPFLNGSPVTVGGMPILWFWVLLWVIITAIVLSIAYAVVERGG